MAIVRRDRSLTTPLENSSRSDSVSAGLDRRRDSGRIPPVRANWPKIEFEYRSKSHPIENIDSPRCQRSHISALCAELYYIRGLWAISYTPSFVLKTPYGAIDGCATPTRSGALPP